MLPCLLQELRGENDGSNQLVSLCQQAMPILDNGVLSSRSPVSISKGGYYTNYIHGLSLVHLSNFVVIAGMILFDKSLPISLLSPTPLSKSKWVWLQISGRDSPNIPLFGKRPSRLERPSRAEL